MKFVLVVPEEFVSHYRQFEHEIAGLLNWARVLGGDVKMVNEDLNGYDTYMVNISSTETEYISVIRMLEPDARIVACFDYGFDIVNQYFTNLERIKQVLSRADIIFSVNKNQEKWMKVILPEKKTYYCPHPADMEAVKKYRKPREARDLGVAAMWHQYDNYHIQSLEVLKAVERKTKQEVNKCLIGLKGRFMIDHGMVIPSASAPTIENGAQTGQYVDPDMEKYVQLVPKGVAWDGVLPYVGVNMWYDFLSRFQVTLDLYTINSIGRFGIDCAGVGVPCVASTKQDSAHILWPQTRVNPFEPAGAIDCVARLLTDPVYYDSVVRTANNRMDYYGFKQSKDRMMEILDEN